MCNANQLVCHYFDQNSNLLQIYCEDQRRFADNCTQGFPTLNPSDEFNLKIGGCDQSFIGNNIEKYPNIKRLDVSDSNYELLDWPGSISEKLIAFDGSGNKLTAIPTLLLSRYPKLLTLRLEENNIKRISVGDFQNFDQELSFLDLSKNRLKFIDDNALANLKSLSEINLKLNQLSAYPVGLSKTNVHTVDLTENPLLTSIDCAFMTEAMSAKNVTVTWKYITAFDGSCSNLKFTVKHGGYDQINNYDDHSDLICDQTNNKNCFKNINNFVAGAGSFKNVSEMLMLLGPSATKIDLSGNHLDGLSENTFQQFPNLRELSLRDTGLTTFYFNYLNNQPHLNHLDISNNNIDWVISPVSLMNFKELASLDMTGNRVKNIDKTVEFLPPSISQLNLSSNPLNNASILNSFERLPALTHLNLSDTQLPINNVDSFDSLRQLTSLDISNIDLSKFNISKLQSLNQLKELRAANSQIKNMPKVIDNLPPSIEKLDLSGNRAAKFDLKTFDRLKNSTNLNLNGINIDELDISADASKEIDVGLLPNSLKRLNLHGKKVKKIKNLNRSHFPVLRTLDVSNTDLDCRAVDKLRLEFKDAEVIGEECFSVWTIILSILALLVIAILIILCCLWICPKICEKDEK